MIIKLKYKLIKLSLWSLQNQLIVYSWIHRPKSLLQKVNCKMSNTYQQKTAKISKQTEHIPGSKAAHPPGASLGVAASGSSPGGARGQWRGAGGSSSTIGSSSTTASPGPGLVNSQWCVRSSPEDICRGRMELSMKLTNMERVTAARPKPTLHLPHFTLTRSNASTILIVQPTFFKHTISSHI